jgi:glycosyltransferase involved in cell wall biosynthesis
MCALISVVVPTHNEAANVSLLKERLDAVFRDLPEYDYELIFADDSGDDTPVVIAAMRQSDRRVKLVRLTRSFGQSAAIAAGLSLAEGGAAVIMDADLQDPPEAIPLLLRKWEAGAQVVYVERPSESKSLVYTLCSALFYCLLKKISDVPIPPRAGEFRLLDRKAVDFLNSLQEHSRFMRGLTMWPGYKSDKITLTRDARSGGKSNYHFPRSLAVAMDGFVSFSIIPLRLAALLGAILAGVGFVLGAAWLAGRLLHPEDYGPGWTSLALLILFMGGLNLMFLGVIGEYVGRCFIELQGRPVYLVEYTLGFEKNRGEVP